MSDNPFTADQILEGARSIRPYLPELLGAQAAQVDRDIASLLQDARAGQPVDRELLDLLKSHEETYYWIAEFLSPDAIAKGFEALPGNSSAVTAQKFICPEGDYVWYQRSSGSPVPTCPTHGALIAIEEEL